MQQAETRAPRGRGRPAVEKRRVPMGLRVTPKMRDELMKRANATGRSITQEMELLLESGLAAQSWQGSGRQMMAAVTAVFSDYGEARARALGVETAEWTNNADCYQMAALAVIRMLLEVSPPPFDGTSWHMRIENILLNVHRMRTGLGPQTPEEDRRDQQEKKP
jgi:hypothetical protein